MPRKDYDDIKSKFAQFVACLKTRDLNMLNTLVIDNVRCVISVASANNDRLNQLDILRNFVKKYPKTDVLKLSIYTYNCRLKESHAQQIAHIVCESLNYVSGRDEMDVFYYGLLCANHWIKTQTGWMMDEVHIDVYPFYGNLRRYFENTWDFGPALAETIENVRLPAIEGEYDLPWICIPDAEDVLTEEEKIKECFAKMYFSADYLMNSYRVEACSKRMNTNAVRFGENEGIRNMLVPLRYKRLKDRYWCHPYKLENIQINKTKDYAICKTYRVFGWKQRNHEYVWTRGNVNVEHVCVMGYTEFVKELGEWCIADQRLQLGLFETGPYSEILYGD